MYDSPMRLVLVPLLVLSIAATVSAKDPVYRLSIGDPARKDKDAAVTLDAITDTATGETIAPRDLAARMAKAQLILVGETHTSVESHRVELQVIKALADAGRHVTIGLEMFPYPSQPALDTWNQGQQSEQDFIAASHWYEAWGYHWGYYRDIFLFARDHHFPVVAVNAPRDVVTAVRQKGLASLPADQSAHFPPRIDVSSADHMTFFKASFDEGDAMHGGMTDAAWTGMLSAQATWDGTMAWNAVKALERVGSDPAAAVVVLVGSGHVAYGLGIERQARTYFTAPIASVIAMPIADDHGAAIPSVRASYANFIWGVARETDSYWPSLGVSTRAAEQGKRVIIDVEKDTPGQAAGLLVGDVIVSIDGTSIDSRETMNMVLASYRWGDTPVFVVLRNASDVTVTVPLRRAR
jgi:uncharacterized iron-regulated protein